MQVPIENGVNEAEDSQQAGGVSAPQRLLLRVGEAAQILGICRSKVYELLYAGSLPSVKLGSSRRIRFSDLESFVRELEEA